jgi:hypothetical protein
MPSLQIKITTDIFEAHLKCPMKCWLRNNDEPFSGIAYTEWMRTQSHTYCTAGTELLAAQLSSNELALSPSLCNLESEKWRTATGILVQTQTGNYMLESVLQAVDRVASTTRAVSSHFRLSLRVWPARRCSLISQGRVGMRKSALMCTKMAH